MELQLLALLATLSALAGAASASVVAPIAAPVLAKLADSEFDPNPQYSFAYDVHDALTGDFKSQTESRNGGVVQGQYSVVDPDGTRRIVDYAADPINGFNAVVSKAPLVRAVPAVPAAPVIAASARVVAPAPAAPARLAAFAAPAFAPPAFAPAPLAAPLSIARVAYASPYAVY